MKIKIIFFGNLIEQSGKQSRVLGIPSSVKTAGELKTFLDKKFEFLSTSGYRIAINHKIVPDNFIFEANEPVALLPPFAGG